MKRTPALRRFESATPKPETAIGLSAGHAALSEGRTIFPTTVVASTASPRFLISGHNNPKLGREVMKGPRKGWPIFHITLEERATCPRSCEQWASCYGNAMPQSRRHTPDRDFLPLLVAEVATVARQLPNGLLIRLHALGDFYSVAYVEAWAGLLAKFPQIHVFGYTARREDDPDQEGAKIARSIRLLTDGAWERFAIRTSASDPIARSRSIVVDADPAVPDTIVCPAQTGATEACATCGLCWADNTRDKTIAFLRHGMTSRRGPPVEPRAPQEQSKLDRLLVWMREDIGKLLSEHPNGVSATLLITRYDEEYSRIVNACRRLEAEGLAAWVQCRDAKHKVLMPPGTKPTATLTDRQARVFSALKLRERDGVAAPTIRDLARDADVAAGSIVAITDALEKKGYIERQPHVGKPPQTTAFQVVDVVQRRNADVAKSVTASGYFHRDERDRRRPAATVTRKLMGDPAPGRTPWAAPPSDQEG